MFLNFFFDLNSSLNTAIFILGFVIIIFYKKNFDIVKIIKNLIILSFIAFITFILDHSNRPDAGLYHLPYISILNEEKIILGSVNLHFRFGHTSSLQYIFALFNNFIFKDNGILIPLAVLYSSIILFFFKEYKRNSDIILKLYSLLSVIFILTSMNRYSGFGNDDPAHMFYLISTYYFLKFYLKKTNLQEVFNLVVIYCIYTFLIKQFYVLVIILPSILFLLNFKKIIIFNKSNFFSTSLLFLWLLKNLLTTSCILYPVNITCFDDLKWSPKNTFSSAERVGIASEAWAKAFPDRINKKKNYVDHLSDFEWIKGWYQSHSKIVIKKLSPLLTIIVILILFLNVRKDFKNKIKNKTDNSVFLILLLNLLFSIIWFLKFPTYRYGAAYLGTFVIASALVFLSNPNFFKISRNIINATLILLTIFILTKNLNRIVGNYKFKYVDYPWPKKNSFTKENSKNINSPVIKNNEIIYYTADPYPLCMYSKSPCTSFKNIKINRNINKFRYKVFFPNNQNN